MPNTFQMGIFITIVVVVLFGLQYYILWRLSYIFSFEYGTKHIVFILSCAVAFILVMYFSHTFDNVIIRVTFIVMMVYLGFLWMTFCLLLLHNIVNLFVIVPKGFMRYFLIVTIAALMFYSIINGRALSIKTVEIKSKKIINDVQIVLLSDIHLGMINRKSYLNDIVEKTIRLNPDIVFLTGDLFSEYIEKDMLTPFQKIKVPFYFVNGNHEFIMNIEWSQKMLEYLPVKTLRGNSFSHDNLQISGIDDITIQKDKKLDEILSELRIDTSKFNILLSHQPFDISKLDEYSIDLMLSGHTHGGQIFPFSLLTKIFYTNVVGLYKSEKGSCLYVSPGTGTWGPPMRLGTSNEITLIKLKKTGS